MKTAGPISYKVVFLATIAILFYRMPERLLGGYLWAEDTRVFLAGAYARGWSGLFESYAAYMVTVPRIIAIAATKVVGLDLVPYVLPWAAMVISGLAGVYVYSVARTIAWRPNQTSTGWALAIALAPLLVPNYGEVFLTITNLQWVLCPALIVLVWETFWRPAALQGNRNFVLRCVCIFLITTTGPYGAFVWPLSVAGFLFHRDGLRDRRRLLIMAIYSAGVAIQVGAVLSAGRPPKPPLNDLPWVHDFLVHVIADMFVPGDLLAKMSHTWWMGAILLIAVTACILSTNKRYWCLFIGAFGIAIWASAMAWINLPNVSFSWQFAGTRYLYLPAVMLAWSLLMSAAAGGPRVTVVCISLAVMMLMTAAGRFRGEQFQRWTITESPAGRTLASPPDPSWSVTVPR